MEKYLRVGKIINTHGIKGELKILPLTDDPKRFDYLKKVFIDKGGIFESLNISHVKYFKNMVLVKFKEINDLNAAEAYKEQYILVDRENAVKLPEGRFFISDIVGCEVVEENGNKLGVVTDVLSTGSNDVYVVKNENSREILVPALKSVVKSVLINEKRITVSLPKGLVDDEV
ncbi:MAG TPA: 16S rRNA processing protein RimM [Clostridiaceae bacterium]|nr:16S rRNA processing protein RimM [Clostridiaceae bacterium]